MLIPHKGHTDTIQVYSVTVMTHVKALQAGHSSQGTFEPITPACLPIFRKTVAIASYDAGLYTGCPIVCAGGGIPLYYVCLLYVHIVIHQLFLLTHRIPCTNDHLFCEHELEFLVQSVQYDHAFDWLLLQPGPGHIEMQMLKAFVRLKWDVFYEDMVELFNFPSVVAKASATKVNDHHKGWTLLRIAREALIKELLVPYVRTMIVNSDSASNPLSCADFLKYVRTHVHNPNYAFICDIALEIMDSIITYRAGTRCGNTDLMDAGISVFSKVWFSRNHPMYRELVVYDTALKLSMPPEMLNTIKKTVSQFD